MRARAVAAALSFAIAALANGAAVRSQPVPAVRAIDTAKSKATFSVQHVFVERVVGTMPIVGGAVLLLPDSVIPESVSAQLDPGRIASGDRDRDALLTSADFFDAKTYPTCSFTSTKITPVNAGAFTIDGTLTIHGVTQPEHLDATVRGDAEHPVYHAVGHIDRRAFHMAVTRLDPVIGPTADVTLDVVLK